MKNLKNKYVNQYLKRNAVLISFFVLPLTVLFLIAALVLDMLAGNIYLCFIPLAVGLLCFLFSCIRSIKFRLMIRSQEKKYNVIFNDENVRSVGTGGNTYLSDGWLIKAGAYALCREYIVKFSMKTLEGGKAGGVGYKVIAETMDGQLFGFWTASSSDIKIYKDWRTNK